MSTWVRIGNAADEDAHHYVNLDQMRSAYVIALTVPSGDWGIELSDGTTTYDVFGRWVSEAEADDTLALLLPGRQAQDVLPS